MLSAAANRGLNPLDPNRETQADKVRKMFAKAQAMYAPGGAYTQGIEAMLARQEKKAQASGMQGLASAGLANTSMVGGLANKFQEETAVPALAQAESQRVSSLADLFARQAGFEASRPEYTVSRSMAGSMTPGILTRNLGKRATAPAPAQQPQLPRLNLQMPSVQQGAAPMFNEAYVGDPNVRSNTGRKIGTRLTGTYNIPTGRMTSNFNTPSREAFGL